MRIHAISGLAEENRVRLTCSRLIVRPSKFLNGSTYSQYMNRPALCVIVGAASNVYAWVTLQPHWHLPNAVEAEWGSPVGSSLRGTAITACTIPPAQRKIWLSTVDSVCCCPFCTPRGNHCTALCATFRLYSPLKSPQTDSSQTLSKLGHPYYPSSTQLLATFPSQKTLCKTEKAMYCSGRRSGLYTLNNMQCSFCSAFNLRCGNLCAQQNTVWIPKGTQGLLGKGKGK